MTESHLVRSTQVKVLGSLSEGSFNTVMGGEPHYGGWRNKTLKKWDLVSLKGVENQTTKIWSIWSG